MNGWRAGVLACAVFLHLLPPAAAMEGGAPATSADPAARATVAVQAVTPMPDGRARVRDCTGVLIAVDLVLTAAHCLDEAPGPEHVAVFFFDGAKAVPPPALVAAIARHPGHERGWARTFTDIETRQAKIAADLALLRLALPQADRRPLAVGDPGDGAAAPKLAGAGASGAGGKGSGTLRSTPLEGLRFTASGPRLAFATPSKARVCSGDSGGPVTTDAGAALRLWGIAGAILRGSGGCAARVVVVPVDPGSAGWRAMRSAVGR